MNTKVTAMALDISDPRVIWELSTCDILVGCMDSIRGRHILNKISSYYGLPYLDTGVQLKADGKGGITTICGSIRYIKPGGASLFSMNVYTIEGLQAESMKHDDPKHHAEQEENKYIQNADESAPAVMPVNGTIVNWAIMDLLARIHPYRFENNSEFNVLNINFCDVAIDTKLVSEPCLLFSKNLCAGDVTPLLGLPSVKRREKYEESLQSM
jgi:hypothetical protein